jgi:hypothetical protein
MAKPRKYQRPDFLDSTVTQESYEKWLHGRAVAWRWPTSSVMARVATQLRHAKVIELRFTTPY